MEGNSVAASSSSLRIAWFVSWISSTNVSIEERRFPSLRLGLPAPKPSRRHHAQSLLGPSFHDPKNASCSRIQPRASCDSLLPQRWAMPRHRLSLRPCLAPPSCSLQPLLKLSLLSLRPSLLQFVSIISPHSPSLRLGLPAPQPLICHHAQSLLGPSFHDPGTHHVFKSNPEQTATLSRRDDERCHAVGLHSALALRLRLVACSPSSSCRFWVLDHLYSNLSQSFHLCWITEIWSLNLCVRFTFSSSAFTFLIEMNFSFKSLFAIWLLSPQQFHDYFFFSIVSWQYQKYSTILILVLCLLCVTRQFADLTQALPRLHLGR